MQSRAPIDVSCEAAKDITFSCLRYLAATIIRWVKGVRGRANVLFSPFVRENMLVRQARPYLTRWYGFLFFFFLFSFHVPTVHGAKGCSRVRVRTCAPSRNFKASKVSRATREVENDLIFGFVIERSNEVSWGGITKTIRKRIALFGDFWDGLTFVGEAGSWIKSWVDFVKRNCASLVGVKLLYEFRSLARRIVSWSWLFTWKCSKCAFKLQVIVGILIIYNVKH